MLTAGRSSPAGSARRQAGCDGRHSLSFYDMPAARLMYGAVRSARSRADYGRRVVGSAASSCRSRLTTRAAQACSDLLFLQRRLTRLKLLRAIKDAHA